ncbi:hypothetical protein N7495_007500 [Penicillium taxi]|uniref:uncharacterized protein n=1 Tax=Penicillium taxi TaxID=168475 RepID=UPI0025459FF3|nr:uncharacterized protein N7495_007500 [Penicillium taxi]KAJ5887459.1 hypothetical protein N7495_007500 [Penicillium taxi]
MLDQLSALDDSRLYKSILSVVTTVYQPITLCGSFLTLRERTILLIHHSAKDFLVREAAHEIFSDG